MRLSASIIILLTTLQAQAPGRLPADVRAAADRITAADLKRDLDFFASDALEGRNTPSPGFDLAAEYIAKRLTAAGLKPLGDNGTFFQRYEMRESRVTTEKATMAIAGRTLAFGDDFVMRSLAAPVSGTYPVVYVGHGWIVPDRKIDPYAGVDVRGKIVVAHGPRALPKGVDIPQIGRVSVGATPVMTEAHERGAVAVIIVPQAAALEGWEAARTQNLTRRELEPWVPSAYAAAPLTSIMLNTEATDALFAGERVGGSDMRARGDAADFPASFELSKSIRIEIPVTSVSHRPYNVVAGIDGSDAALRNEYITIESHLDGAVGTRTVDGDAIYNSADDNATGSAGTLAIAEQMITVRPKRSLIFIWDSGEERGLWGTRYFVHAPPVPLERIVAHFNIDMIGATRAAGTGDANSPEVSGPNEVYLAGPGVLSTSANALLEAVNRDYGKMLFNRRYDTAASEFFYPRTDAGPFLERGILTINFFTGLHPRYHLPADEAKYLDPVKMEAVTRTVFASVWALASAAERPRIDQAIPISVPRYGAASAKRRP
jgi:Zn-dependent M28 family amino/carboxypeptidase